MGWREALCNCLEDGQRQSPFCGAVLSASEASFFRQGSPGKVRSVIFASVSDPPEEVSDVEYERVRRNGETSEGRCRDTVLLLWSGIKWFV